jgi:hypothetical protein
MTGQQKGGKDPSPFQAADDFLFERGWIGKPHLIYLTEDILKAPEILIETIERGCDAQDNDCQGYPARFFRRRDLGNEKKDHKVTNQIKKKIAADSIVYGLEGIKNSQDKKDNERKRKSGFLYLQRPL